MEFTHACFTYAIPGYWLTKVGGEKHFSADGRELSEAGKLRAREFPCNCDKALSPQDLAGGR